jgi:hypothetical protein
MSDKSMKWVRLKPGKGPSSFKYLSKPVLQFYKEDPTTKESTRLQVDLDVASYLLGVDGGGVFEICMAPGKQVEEVVASRKGARVSSRAPAPKPEPEPADGDEDDGEPDNPYAGLTKGTLHRMKKVELQALARDMGLEDLAANGTHGQIKEGILEAKDIVGAAKADAEASE